MQGETGAVRGMKLIRSRVVFVRGGLREAPSAYLKLRLLVAHLALSLKSEGS
jgi:hypothetical protein